MADVYGRDKITDTVSYQRETLYITGGCDILYQYAIIVYGKLSTL